MSNKFCIDCKYYKYNQFVPVHRCIHPSLAPVSVVTGQAKVVSCGLLRFSKDPKDYASNPQLCYEEGVYWEAK